MAKINGKESIHFVNKNILELLNQRNQNINNVVIELNGVIIAKSDYERTVIKSDDKIEIITFVGGG